MSRPEHQGPADVFYDEEEAKKYLTSSRMVEIQSRMAERCVELLALPTDGEGSLESPSSFLLLDLGCGTGLSGDILSEHGHVWVGLDISEAMLKVAKRVRDVEGDLFARDLGDGVGMFRTGSFDGAISVSALQWLCNLDSTMSGTQEGGGTSTRSGVGAVVHRLNVFFSSLYAVLRKGSRAVFQFYPENDDQLELITSSAMRNGFSGGVVIDFPHSSKAKKYYLCLNAGTVNRDTTGGAEGAEKQVHSMKRERPRKARHGKGAISAREWIIAKKQRQRRTGSEVRPDSKYTGRRRSKKF